MVNGTSVLDTVFLVPTPAGPYNNTHAHSRTHTQMQRSRLLKREKLAARLMYRGHLSFDGCCGTLKQKTFDKKGVHSPKTLTKTGTLLFVDGDVCFLRQIDSKSNLLRLSSSLGSSQPPRVVFSFSPSA